MFWWIKYNNCPYLAIFFCCFVFFCLANFQVLVAKYNKYKIWKRSLIYAAGGDDVWLRTNVPFVWFHCDAIGAFDRIPILYTGVLPRIRRRINDAGIIKQWLINFGSYIFELKGCLQLACLLLSCNDQHQPVDDSS